MSQDYIDYPYIQEHFDKLQQDIKSQMSLLHQMGDISVEVNHIYSTLNGSIVLIRENRDMRDPFQSNTINSYSGFVMKKPPYIEIDDANFYGGFAYQHNGLLFCSPEHLTLNRLGFTCVKHLGDLDMLLEFFNS